MFQYLLLAIVKGLEEGVGFAEGESRRGFGGDNFSSRRVQHMKICLKRHSFL